MAGSTGLGLLCVVVASVCFGSNFVVTKKYKTGDGMFFQLMMCTGVLLVGIGVSLARGSPQLQPLAMLGGVLWATGNVCVVPIVKSIGLSMGLVIWGIANMMTGWASGQFGYLLHLIKRQEVEHPALNYIGVAVAALAVVASAQVKPRLGKAGEEGEEGEGERRLLADDLADRGLHAGAGAGGGGAGGGGGGDGYGSLRSPVDIESSGRRASALSRSRGSRDDSEFSREPTRGRHGHGHTGQQQQQQEEEEEEMFVDRLSPAGKRTFGIAASLVSGVFYGLNFDPPQYVMDHVAGASQEPLDYVLSHFLGIFVTSVFWFVVYAASRSNAPRLYAEICLPGMLCGVVWAAAQTAWFVANANLEFVVAFPLITTGPGLVGCLWGLCVFGEIRGQRNYAFLGATFLLSAVADVLIVASHPK